MIRVLYRVELDGKPFMENATAEQVASMLGIYREGEASVSMQTAPHKFGALAREWDRYMERLRAAVRWVGDDG